MPDFVRVVNVDDKTFKYHFRNEPKSIPAGREVMMPWNLAVTLFGDPFSTDQPKKPDRTDSLRRARSNFNYELGMETMEHFMERVPKVEVYDSETQQRIHMLIEDPEGEHKDDFIPMDHESTDTVTLLTQQVNLLQQQIGLLIAQQTGQAPPMPSGQTTTPSSDNPGIIPVPTDGIKAAEWVDGDPFAQREDDVLAKPLWDFEQMSQNPVVEDGMAIDPSNSVPEDRPTVDAPQDAGVGSTRAKSRLAPKK